MKTAVVKGLMPSKTARDPRNPNFCGGRDNTSTSCN